MFDETGRWSLSARLIAGAGGLGCLALASRQYGFSRLGLGAIGVGLVFRATSDRPSRQLFGLDPEAIEADRSIVIHKPLEEVFALFGNYQNYPDFLPNVRAMRIVTEMEHRWTLLGPLGFPIPVHDKMIAWRPPHFVAWRSEPDSLLPYAGQARFTAVADGTLVEARMSYGPPAGPVGDALVRMLGEDPGSQLDMILGGAKAYLENGHSPREEALAVTPAVV
jgi:uncharacterized membrane protein